MQDIKSGFYYRSVTNSCQSGSIIVRKKWLNRTQAAKKRPRSPFGNRGLFAPPPGFALYSPTSCRLAPGRGMRSRQRPVGSNRAISSNDRISRGAHSHRTRAQRPNAALDFVRPPASTRNRHSDSAKTKEKAHFSVRLFFCLAPPPGFEPGTQWLTGKANTPKAPNA
jgi:hypothetical protein